MLALHGTGVSEGISLGKAHVLRRKRLDTREYVIPESLLEEEVTRFTRAIELARTQLEQVRIHIPAGAPAETASFIDTHLLILSDPMISEAPIDFIRTARRNAEWALKTQSEDLSRMFEGMEDPYLRARRVDVEQVVDRVLRNLLTPREKEHEELAAGDILVASDLSPADAVMLKHQHVNAFVTELGGPISHTAILARSLGIPAVVAVHNATRFLRNGDTLIIDGNRGLLIAGRDRKILAEYRRRKQDLRRAHEQLGRLRSGRSVTRDGRKVRLLANIELP
ncbi:MAG: phosphoenolpyruvate-utilizing N-terminal domain-containing protein, partial [Acidiferrobacterales bacterium]